ncbi:type II toxin-antitoxin system RelE/ParE family toxin [Serratia ureilytica]|uniref:type II toxin-antitoxin system RelE/ParE family toxin n=1 Tax=Serratia ureilytica TaxID=300181 RepID=UPI00396A6B17
MDDGIEKAIDWRGSSLEDLLAFPIDARKAAGFELSKVQRGLEPGNWKTMTSCGSGVIEIRLYAIGGAFRGAMWQSSAKRSTFCTAFKRRRRKPAATIFR